MQFCNRIKPEQTSAFALAFLPSERYNYIKINNDISGELVLQAERKVRPSTHLPDLDNANAGIA